MVTEYCTFSTEIGPCGIAWRKSNGEAALRGFRLPEATEESTAAHMAEQFDAVAATAPAPIQRIIAKVRKHLQGDPQDFTGIAVDVSNLGTFSQKVYAAARKIPAGQTRSYGQIARALGQPNASRAVGQALGRNPVALIVPCHRVLAAGGKPGGFSAYGGWSTKCKLLELESAGQMLSVAGG